MQCAHAVATGVIGDAMGKRGAHILHAKAVNEEFAELVDAGQKGGEILFISSVAGLQGYAGEAVYCASKFAQIGFAQALDGELRKHGIKVGTICPGGVKTEFAVGKGRTEEGVKSSYMMEPYEVADAIVFACMQPRNARILQMTVRHMGEPGR